MTTSEGPLEYRFRVDDMADDVVQFTVPVSTETRSRLARHLGVESLNNLEVKGCVRRRADRISYALTLTVAANVTQLCVVSLEPVTANIDETMTLVYTPSEARSEPTDVEVEIDVAADDPPEPLIDQCIDVGGLAVELLTLGIDPYPRKAGAELPVDDASDQDASNQDASDQDVSDQDASDHGAEQAADKRDHPFADLARLKQRA